MKEHEHAAKNVPETTPAGDEVPRNAHAIHLKEGHPPGHAKQSRALLHIYTG